MFIINKIYFNNSSKLVIKSVNSNLFFGIIIIGIRKVFKLFNCKII